MSGQICQANGHDHVRYADHAQNCEDPFRPAGPGGLVQERYQDGRQDHGHHGHVHDNLTADSKDHGRHKPQRLIEGQKVPLRLDSGRRGGQGVDFGAELYRQEDREKHEEHKPKCPGNHVPVEIIREEWNSPSRRSHADRNAGPVKLNPSTTSSKVIPLIHISSRGLRYALMKYVLNRWRRTAATIRFADHECRERTNQPYGTWDTMNRRLSFAV